MMNTEHTTITVRVTTCDNACRITLQVTATQSKSLLEKDACTPAGLANILAVGQGSNQHLTLYGKYVAMGQGISQKAHLILV